MPSTAKPLVGAWISILLFWALMVLVLTHNPNDIWPFGYGVLAGGFTGFALCASIVEYQDWKST